MPGRGWLWVMTVPMLWTIDSVARVTMNECGMRPTT